MSDYLIYSIVVLGSFPFALLFVRAIFKKSIVSTMINWTLVIMYFVSFTNYYGGDEGIYMMWFILPLYFGVGIAVFIYIKKKLKVPLVKLINAIKEISDGKLK